MMVNNDVKHKANRRYILDIFRPTYRNIDSIDPNVYPITSPWFLVKSPILWKSFSTFCRHGFLQTVFFPQAAAPAPAEALFFFLGEHLNCRWVNHLQNRGTTLGNHWKSLEHHGKKIWFAPTYGFLQAEGSIFDALPGFGSFVPDLSGLSELPSVLEDTRVPQARPIPTPKKTKPPPWRGAGCSDGPVRTGHNRAFNGMKELLQLVVYILWLLSSLLSLLLLLLILIIFMIIIIIIFMIIIIIIFITIIIIISIIIMIISIIIVVIMICFYIVEYIHIHIYIYILYVCVYQTS